MRLLRLEETPHLLRREGQSFRWNGGPHTWSRHQVQSFVALRRMVPQLMGFEGRALLLDPDVIALGDVHDLLVREMGGKAIVARRRPGSSFDGRPRYNSSVMLLDCAQLTYWQWDREIDAIFDGAFDFGPWITLATEPAETIGPLPDAWNSLDTLDEHTKLLHFTERSTQPWRVGLPMDADAIRPDPGRGRGSLRARLLRAIGRGEPARPSAWLGLPHPDPRQQHLFFSLLRECLEHGEVTQESLHDAIARRHARADLLDVLRALP